ncbi:MAG: V-type ATP synthase subunit K [Candidatus Fermentithermobacillus carboniphilus]|uniref:V-type ATP synthase subunit K n=1 Tax=Candidatus Fermentithermobacillus carboniphilus TaxID=3085328 RepID=A0AAT9LFZ7_9FIRM|nr:MAG: V-type ATP synthase subunit K [Candidatus Fermentithermobacillus carboniphilus]
MLVLFGLLVSFLALGTAAFFGEVLGGNGIALIGAGLAVFLSGMGSTIGVGIAGEKAAGITAEDPEKFGRLLLLQALPGTQGIYGFLVGFLAMFRMGAFSGGMNLTIDQGWQFLFACLPVAITCLVSGLYQARVSIAGMDIVAKHPEESGKALILPAMVETYAVLGLLASVLLLMFAVKV